MDSFHFLLARNVQLSSKTLLCGQEQPQSDEVCEDTKEVTLQRQEHNHQWKRVVDKHFYNPLLLQLVGTYYFYFYIIIYY